MAITRGKTTAKRTSYFIANHHTATIVIPRSGQGAVRLQPIIIPAGKSIVMEADDWNRLRTNSGVMNYINHGMLSEVEKEGDVPVSPVSASNLVIPEHLMRDEEVGTQTDVTAKVRRKTSSKIVI